MIATLLASVLTTLLVFAFALWQRRRANDGRDAMRIAQDKTDKALAREAVALEELKQAHARLGVVGTMMDSFCAAPSVGWFRGACASLVDNLPAGADPSQGEIAEILAEHGLKWIGKED